MSESTPRASATFSRVMSKGSLSLSRFASNVGPPQLEELKLAHVLNGETCPPISFADFAAFVAYREYTTENLLFVVWYRNYRARFEALNCRSRAAIPIPSTRLGDRFTPFAYLDKAIAERKAAGLDSPQTPQPDGGISFDQLIRVDSRRPKQKQTARNKTESLGSTGTGSGSGSRPCAWNSEGSCVGSCKTSTKKPSLLTRLASRTSISKDTKSNGAPSILHSTLYPPLPPPGTVFTPPELQPMRAEAQRAFATFLRKGGSRELGISDELREFVRDCLKRSTAPECFLPIYEEIYQAVETQSLPRFLASAKRNINRPKELFWYAVGIADLFIGVIVFLIMSLLLPSHPFGWRALRLISTIFVSFGFMQAYSAYRGFCSQVWGRSNRQVSSWEMDQVDDEEIRLESVASDRHDLHMSAAGRFTESEDERKQAISMDEGLFKETENAADGETSAKEGEGAYRTIAREVSTSHDHNHDGELPAGVHALSDVGGYVDYSLDSPANQSPKTVSPSIGLPVLEREDESSLEVSPTSKRPTTIGSNPRTLVSGDDEQRARRMSRREISPFEVEYEPRSNIHGHGHGHGMKISAMSAKASKNGKRLSFGINGRPTSQLEVEVEVENDDDHERVHEHDVTLGELARRTSRDLSMLLSSLRRASQAQPCSSGVGVGRERSRSTTTNGQGGEGGEDSDLFTLNLLELDRKPKVFGPERLIEDPRVKKLMSSIVRDIMVVGLITASIWIVLCFAVPCKGLA